MSYRRFNGVFHATWYLARKVGPEHAIRYLSDNGISVTAQMRTEIERYAYLSY